MEMTAPDADLLATYWTPVLDLAGDRRTATLLGATVRGIGASESLLCWRIAASSPSAGGAA
jgi:hypothetical protein